MTPKTRDPRREIVALRRAVDAGTSHTVSADALRELLRGYDDGLAMRNMIRNLDKLDGRYSGVSGIPCDRELSVVIVTQQSDPTRHAAVCGDEGITELPSATPHGRETPARTAQRCAKTQVGVLAFIDLTLHEVGALLVPREGLLVRVRAYACTKVPTSDLGPDSACKAFWATRAELFSHPTLGEAYTRIFRVFDTWAVEAAKKEQERKGTWKNLV